jgi:hypothetical protein
MPAAAHERSFDIPPDLAADMRGWRTRFLAIGAVALALSIVGGILQCRPVLPLLHLVLYVFHRLAAGSYSPADVAISHRRRVGYGHPAPLRSGFPHLAAAGCLLFIPIVIGIPHLYQWSHADIVAHDRVLQHKQIYLNVPFFLDSRGLVFRGLDTDRTSPISVVGRSGSGDTRAAGRLTAISGPGLIFFGFSVTFMAIDWVLSINPHWFSTIFGLLFIAGEGLSAVAFLICVLVILSSRPPLSEVLTHRHLHDVGKLLLAFVMVWAYFSFSQLLVIWSGNLPEEIPWYHQSLRRRMAVHRRGVWCCCNSRCLSRCCFRGTSNAISNCCVRWRSSSSACVSWIFIGWSRRISIRQQFTVSWMDFLLPIGLGGNLAGGVFVATRTAPAHAAGRSASGGGSGTWPGISHAAEMRNPHVHHEPGDVNARALTKFGLSMAFLIVVFMVGLWGVFDYLKNREAELGLPMSPSAMVNAQKQPPDPGCSASAHRICGTGAPSRIGPAPVCVDRSG